MQHLDIFIFISKYKKVFTFYASKYLQRTKGGVYFSIFYKSFMKNNDKYIHTYIKRHKFLLIKCVIKNRFSGLLILNLLYVCVLSAVSIEHIQYEY